MKMTIELNDLDIKVLKDLRKYYGENDASIFEQNAYNTLNKIVKNLTIPCVSESDLFECPACDQIAVYVAEVFTSRADETRSYDMDVEHCVCKSCGHDWWD